MPVLELSDLNTTVADTFISSPTPDTNYGNSNAVSVGMTSGTTNRGLFKFDLYRIPNDAVINSATLNLRMFGSATTTKEVIVELIKDDWTRTGVTWRGQPEVDPSITSIHPASLSSNYNVDVTNIVKAWISGGKRNFGMRLRDTPETYTVDTTRHFNSSRDATSAYRPKLTIDYTIPTTNQKFVEHVITSNVVEQTHSVNVTFVVPSIAKVGDYVLTQINTTSSDNIQVPSGWTMITNVVDTNTSRRILVMGKFITAVNESTTINSTGTNPRSWAVVCSVFRNVKGVSASNNRTYSASTGTFYPPSTSAVDNNTMAVLVNIITSNSNLYAPKTFNTVAIAMNPMSGRISTALRYMHQETTMNYTDMSTDCAPSSSGSSTIVMLAPIVNTPPTLTLTSPANNQTLVEGSTYKLEGTISDADVGNIVALKYAIGGGLTKSISLGASDGSTPKPFSKTLTYSQGRFWDGAADVSGLLPAEASSIQIWAQDATEESAKVTRNFTIQQEDGKIIIPVNMVSSADYLVSRMAPPVRLSNGWLVGLVYYSAGKTAYLYKSTNNGKNWSQLCYIGSLDGNVSLTSIGTYVYLLATYMNSATDYRVYGRAFDAATITNTNLRAGVITIDSSQTGMSGTTVGITPDGTKLWWAASTKNATYPNSFNIRAGSVPINADGKLGTPSAVDQVTTHNQSGLDVLSPSLAFNSTGVPVLVYSVSSGGNANSIQSRTHTGTSFSASAIRKIYDGVNYAQFSPQIIRTPNGKLHAVWHGTDSSNTTSNQIRYSNSVDGVSWSTPKVLYGGKDASITSDKNGKLFITYVTNGGNVWTVGSSNEFNTAEFSQSFGVGTVPASLYDPTFQTDFTVPPTIFQTTSAVKYYGSLILNKKPVVTLNTPDNQTLTENATYDVAGYAVDEDAGNVVSVYYKINNGPVQAAASGVSDGSTPILFSKQLTYKNKRVYLGTTDITGADLTENVDHILTVWAEDNKQGKSTEVTRKFKVVWNRPPVIDGQNSDIGIHEAPPEVTYAAYDPEGNPFTITEKINGVVTRSFAGVANHQETFEINHDTWLKLEPGVLHTLTIEAVDDQNAKSTRVYTFTRFEDQLSFEIEVPWTTDVAAKRVLLTMDMSLPPGSVFVAEATNNAFDAVPKWEDISFNARYGRGYIFLNEQKTAAKWGVSIRVRIEKGTATEPIIVKGFGGAFD